MTATAWDTTVQPVNGLNDPAAAVDPALADEVLALFSHICDAAAAALAANTEWGASGLRDGQYAVDLDLDAVSVPPLLEAGFAVLSEESGIQDPSGDSRGVVVVDPLDGSTNASLGLPWCATSLCLVLGDAPVVSTVSNLVTGRRYTAVAGQGAWRDGTRLGPLRNAPLDDSVIATSGIAAHHYGWRQFRAMGAGALDICEVANGAFQGFVDMNDAHGVWDYLGGALVVTEAGGVVADCEGRNLVVLDPAARRAPVAAAGPGLLSELLAHRVGGAHEPS